MDARNRVGLGSTLTIRDVNNHKRTSAAILEIHVCAGSCNENTRMSRKRSEIAPVSFYWSFCKTAEMQVDASQFKFLPSNDNLHGLVLTYASLFRRGFGRERETRETTGLASFHLPRDPHALTFFFPSPPLFFHWSRALAGNLCTLLGKNTVTPGGGVTPLNRQYGYMVSVQFSLEKTDTFCFLTTLLGLIAPKGLDTNGTKSHAKVSTASVNRLQHRDYPTLFEKSRKKSIFAKNH